MKLFESVELWAAGGAFLVVVVMANLAEQRVLDYHEECVVEGCSTEELAELYSSYAEECINEGCSAEEINELSGDPTETNSMLSQFLKNQWIIRSQDISSTYMPSNSAWLYSDANYSGLLFQVWQPVNPQVSDLSAFGFNDMVSSLRVGSAVYLATFNDSSFRNAQLTVSGAQANQASLGAPFNDAISSAQVTLLSGVAPAVANIEQAVGAPPRSGAQASRTTAGINSSFLVQLDVGGEGPTNGCGVVSGFAQAMNLNASSQTTTCWPYSAIPNLVLLAPWSTNPTYPFVDGFADYITMQGAPLTSTNVSEMARTLRSGGTIALWIDVDGFQGAINQLASALNTTPIFNAYDEFQGQAGWPKTLIVDNR
ncbi:MAG TPA: hypothetical protein VHN14_11895 [Kofleriaceae bacterium]|nr:hypothetical protein [Kofleriaceae bacterium]